MRANVGKGTQQGGGERGGRQASQNSNDGRHLKWCRGALRGLMYIHTDKGPMRAWVHQIPKAPDPLCGCGDTQNAAHLLASGRASGLKRKWEDIRTGPAFCTEVTSFLLSQG